MMLVYTVMVTTLQLVSSYSRSIKENLISPRTDSGSYQKQSPVDLITSQSALAPLPALSLIWSDGLEDVVATLFNDGYTVLLSFENEIVLRGGPLPNDYKFEQLHFHWGIRDFWGSEHFVNGTSLSLECHLVFYNSRYSTFTTASRRADGLAVVGILAKAVDEDNGFLKAITDVVPRVRAARSSSPLNAAKGMGWALNEINNNNEYFTYNGSLTTPPFTENVIWIVLRKEGFVSHAQLKVFRTIKDLKGDDVLINKREVQPLLARSTLRSEIRHQQI